MQNWPKPKTIKALRGFLCLIGYYRKFIQGYEKIARLLTHMLKKGCFQWNSKAEESFDSRKEVMTKALPDFTQPFIVVCDVSSSVMLYKVKIYTFLLIKKRC